MCCLIMLDTDDIYAIFAHDRSENKKDLRKTRVHLVQNCMGIFSFVLVDKICPMVVQENDECSNLSATSAIGIIPHNLLLHFSFSVIECIDRMH